jgi:hypothetical protein
MAKGLQANSDAGFKGFMGVHDLNFNLRICDVLGFEQAGVTRERGQDAVCAGHGVRAMEDPHQIERYERRKPAAPRTIPYARSF